MYKIKYKSIFKRIFIQVDVFVNFIYNNKIMMRVQCGFINFREENCKQIRLYKREFLYYMIYVFVFLNLEKM